MDAAETFRDKAMRLTVLFFRGDHFYPITMLEPSECGRSIERQVADHAELNPGTTKVEDINGRVLWCVQ